MDSLLISNVNSDSTSATDPCAALRRASRAVSHLYDLVLSPTGLKATQFIVLHAIHEHGEIAQWRLADEYGVGDDTLSRRLGTLRKAGWVSYRIGFERPGEKLYRLTPAGIGKHDDALPCFARAQQRLRLTLGEEQWELLLRITQEVVAEARRAEAVRFPNTAPIKAYRAYAAAAQTGARL